MAFQYVKLMEVAEIPTTVGAIYANGANETTYVSDIDIHNTSDASRSVTIYLVPDSSGALGTAASTNQVFQLTVAAADTVMLELRFPYVLSDESDAIFAVADGTGVNIQVRGGKS